MAQPNSMFNEESADVVFRSSDGVEFWLHKIILSLASPVFKGMFSLPRDPDAGRETVEVTEVASTMEDLLRFCYPMRPPELPQLDRLSDALHAAMKYEMSFLVSQLKTRLRNFIESDAMRVYCIAYKYEDAELAQSAAERLLQQPRLFDLLNPPPEFSQLPIIALAKLMAYRKQCAVAAATVLMDDGWMMTGFRNHDGIRRSRKNNLVVGSESWVWLQCESCSAGTVDYPFRFSPESSPHSVRPRRWWQAYRDAVVKELPRFLRPLPSVASQDRLIQPAVGCAEKCELCGPQAAAELSEYAEGVGKRIEEVLAKVRVDFPFRSAGPVSEDHGDCDGPVG
ncbi:hypothetical protein FKP32DRAFT_1592775 [Trametes sanguinea]|nr:hypothetical protein FKP32DRAFT_1592775 [Trametes sanguinea]